MIFFVNLFLKPNVFRKINLLSKFCFETFLMNIFRRTFVSLIVLSLKKTFYFINKKKKLTYALRFLLSKCTDAFEDVYRFMPRFVTAFPPLFECVCSGFFFVARCSSDVINGY